MIIRDPDWPDLESHVLFLFFDGEPRDPELPFLLFFPAACALSKVQTSDSDRRFEVFYFVPSVRAFLPARKRADLIKIASPYDVSSVGQAHRRAAVRMHSPILRPDSVRAMQL